MTYKHIGQVARYKPLRECGMEELAAHQETVDPSGGILFARKADGDGKVAARQQVLDIFSNEQWPQRLNMLVMPSLSWRFERLLLGAREPGWFRRRKPRRTHFTAVENDRAIFYGGCTQMPGLETPDALMWPVAPHKFPFAEAAVKTRYASFFFANVDDLMDHAWVRGPYRERTGWDAAWLDYTGPLNPKRLAGIQKFYETSIHGVLVVTSLKARWDRRTSAAIERAGGHSQWVRQNLPGEVLHDLEYFDTSPMSQIAIRKKKEA